MFTMVRQSHCFPLFFWFSSRGRIIIVVRTMDSIGIKYVLIALIVSSDLVASVSRYPWQDHEMSLNSIEIGPDGQSVRGVFGAGPIDLKPRVYTAFVVDAEARQSGYGVPLLQLL